MFGAVAVDELLGFGHLLDHGVDGPAHVLLGLGRGEEEAQAAFALLRRQWEADLAAFDQKCTYLELSSSKEFMENYVEYMAFDEDE